jgi:hypothetical protein
MVMTLRNPGSMARAKAMLRRIDEAKDGGSGRRRGHYHQYGDNPQIVIGDPSLLDPHVMYAHPHKLQPSMYHLQWVPRSGMS